MSGHGVPHHAANDEHKRIGIFIGVLAVIMAVIGAFAKGQANEMIVKEIQASNKEVKASNGFAWYQAKRQRSYLNDLELKRIEFELAGTANEAQKKLLEGQKLKLTGKNTEYEAEGKVIIAEAEAERASAEADRTAATTAAHKHHWFEYGEISLHIAVVLCSLVLLTDQKIFFKIGLFATVVGVLLAVAAFFKAGHHEAEHPAAAPTTSAPAVSTPAKAPAH